MQIISKIEELKDLIKTDLETKGFTNYNYFVGRPELFEEDIQKNNNLFPMIMITNINYNLENQLSENYYIGNITFSLAISRMDSQKPIFDYLDSNIVKSVLDTLIKTDDVQVLNRVYDDSIDCIYTVILELSVAFSYEL